MTRNALNRYILAYFIGHFTQKKLKLKKSIFFNILETENILFLVIKNSFSQTMRAHMTKKTL